MAPVARRYASRMSSAVGAGLYEVPPEFVEFRDAIRQIAQERVAPRAAEIDAKAEYPWDSAQALRRARPARACRSPRSTAAPGPARSCSTSRSRRSRRRARRGAHADAAGPRHAADPPRGSPELQERFLPRFATGEWPPAFALSEPEAGSDPAAMTHPRRPRRRRWVLTGTKNWISTPGRRLLRRVRRHRPASRAGITAFVVESDRPGLQRRQARAQARHPRLADRPADLRRRPHPAPRTSSATEGKGLSVALSTLDHSRLGVAAQALGIAQGATDYAVAYAKERRQFGQPIASSRASSSSWPTWRRAPPPRASCSTGRARRPTAATPTSASSRRWRSSSRSDTAMAVTVEAVQVLGGYGYVSEYPVERMMRDAKITQIYEGTNEIQRVVIARQLRDESHPAVGRRRAVCRPRGHRGAGRVQRLDADPAHPGRRVPRAAHLRDRRCDGRRRRADGGLAGARERGGVRARRRARGAPRPRRHRRRARRDGVRRLDPLDDEDFEELVREALDELPDLLQRALGRNVAVVISDGGRRHRAYGLYHGDGVARDDVPDRIIIFRDTLRRDFGHDPDLLRQQVTITVRHELAHHLGADELGVRELGLSAGEAGRRRGRNAATIRRRRSADARRSRASASIAPTPRRCHSSATANVTSDVPSPPGAYCATPAKDPSRGSTAASVTRPSKRSVRACGPRRSRSDASCADTGRTTRRGFGASGMAMPPARSGCAATGSARPRRGWSRPCGSPGCAAGRGPARCRAA